ncbi:hypothetical protein BT62DRAFT_914089, partial [Guyanagaster necrorhizus]
LDCSFTNRKHKLDLDHCETVIEFSIRETVYSDIWYLHLFNQAMAQSYHLLDYG